MDNITNTIDTRDKMIKKPFFDWIIQERDKHQWNDAELSAKAEISHSNLSQIMSSQRNVTFDFCIGLAKAFKVRPEMVLYQAGLLTKPIITKDELTDDEAELVRLYRELPPEHQIALLNVATGLVGKFGKE